MTYKAIKPQPRKELPLSLLMQLNQSFSRPLPYLQHHIFIRALSKTSSLFTAVHFCKIFQAAYYSPPRHLPRGSRALCKTSPKLHSACVLLLPPGIKLHNTTPNIPAWTEAK